MSNYQATSASLQSTEPEYELGKQEETVLRENSDDVATAETAAILFSVSTLVLALARYK